MVSELLQQHIAELRDHGHIVEVEEAGDFVGVIIKGHPLPDGFSKATADVMIKVFPAYPNGKLDMFWTDADLVLSSGAVPHKAESIEDVLKRKLRCFSWHLNDNAWNPATASLLAYLDFIDTRFSKRV
jgi:Prokaryotic E2 family E